MDQCLFKPDQNSKRRQIQEMAQVIAKLPGRFDNYKVSVEFSDAEELDALLD